MTDFINSQTNTLQQETQRLAAIIEAQQSIIQHGFSLDDVMTLTVEQVQLLTRASGAVIELTGKNKPIKYVASGIAGQTTLFARVSNSVLKYCTKIGELRYCPDLQSNQEIDRDDYQQVGAQSIIGVPLLQKSEQVGVLTIFSTTPHFFTEQDTQTLQLMVVFLARALELASAFADKNSLLSALQDSEQQYRMLIESLSEGIVSMNAEAKIWASNPSAESILGLSQDQMMGRSSYDPRWKTIHEDGSAFLGQHHPAIVTLETGQPTRNVVMGVHKPDDSLTWISINTQPLYHPNEVRPYAVVSSFTDISHQKQVEDQLRLLQSLAIEVSSADNFSSALGIVIKIAGETQGFILGEAWVPCPSEQVLKREQFWTQTVQDEALQDRLSYFQQNSQAVTFASNVGLPGRVWHSKEVEYCQDVSRESNSIFLRRQLAEVCGLKSAIGIPILAADGEVLAVIVFFKLKAISPDPILIKSFETISARLSAVLQHKRTEAALRENELRLRLALEGSGDGLWSWNIKTGELYLSPQWLSMLGYVEGDLPLRLETLERLIHPEDYRSVVKQLEAHLRDVSIPYRFTYRLLTKSGGWKWIASYGKVVAWDDEGKPLQMSGTHRDKDLSKRAELELQRSEAELSALFEAMHDLVVVRDWEGRCLKVLSKCSENLILPANEMIGKTVHEIMPPFQANLLLDSIRWSLNQKTTVECEYSLDIKGKEEWFSTNISPVSTNTVVLVIRNISDRKRLEKALYEEKELAQVTLHSIGDGVITTDAFEKVKYLNPVAERLTGWNRDAAYNQPLSTVFKIVQEGTDQAAENPVEKAIREGKTVGLVEQTTLISKNGQEIGVEDSAAPMRDRSGNLIGAVLVFHDVSKTRNLTRQLSWEATHDALTRLVNRRAFETCVGESLESAQAQSINHVLCYLDLDQFKIVNDTCGHSAGDELLRQVTAILEAKIRKSDVLARLGGDEFGLLLYQCSLAQAFQVAEKLRESVQSLRFSWEEQTFKVAVSVGLVEINAHSESLSSVMSAADAACYTAKRKGRNRVHILQSNDQDLLQQRSELQWTNRLLKALEDDSFCLYYQTIAQTTSSSASGEHYEVLLRLRDEDGGIIAPYAFIPAAERYGLMHLIDRWVIRTLFETQGAHYRQIWSDCQQENRSCTAVFAVNLSGASLNDDQFIDFLREQFALHQIPPALICFEITETMAISNLTKAQQFIGELRTLGCSFALDDFGSGMSSFGYLKNLTVDYLKIDGEFIRNIVNDPVAESMVEAMTRIGHVMGLQIVGEFVENEAILARLQSLGIDYAQGYGIAKPRPLMHAYPVK